MGWQLCQPFLLYCWLPSFSLTVLEENIQEEIRNEVFNNFPKLGNNSFVCLTGFPDKFEEIQVNNLCPDFSYSVNEETAFSLREKIKSEADSDEKLIPIIGREVNQMVRRLDDYETSENRSSKTYIFSIRNILSDYGFSLDATLKADVTEVIGNRCDEECNVTLSKTKTEDSNDRLLFSTSFETQRGKEKQLKNKLKKSILKACRMIKSESFGTLEVQTSEHYFSNLLSHLFDAPKVIEEKTEYFLIFDNEFDVRRKFETTDEWKHLCELFEHHSQETVSTSNLLGKLIYWTAIFLKEADKMKRKRVQLTMSELASLKNLFPSTIP